MRKGYEHWFPRQRTRINSAAVPPNIGKLRKRAKGETSAEWEEWEKRKTQLEAEFHSLFEPLLRTVGPIELPCEYEWWERKLGHAIAEKLGLQHESVGEGSERRLRVSFKPFQGTS